MKCLLHSGWAFFFEKSYTDVWKSRRLYFFREYPVAAEAWPSVVTVELSNWKTSSYITVEEDDDVHHRLRRAG